LIGSFNYVAIIFKGLRREDGNKTIFVQDLAGY